MNNWISFGAFIMVLALLVGNMMLAKIIVARQDRQQKQMDALQGGKKMFEKIVVDYFPAESCPYPEYKGKPYYSIQYTENGEGFVGYGTFNPDVLSRYLRDYFIGQNTEKEEEK